MRGGTLRHAVTIERPTVALGTRGERVTTWEPVATGVRASISQLGGREAEQAKRLYADATHQVVTRYVPGVTPECRVVFGARVFGVGAINDVEERHVELRLLCAEALN